MKNEQTNKHNGQGHWVHADRRGQGGGEGAGAQPCLPAPSALAPEAVGHASFPCHLSRERREGTGGRCQTLSPQTLKSNICSVFSDDS